MEFSKRETIEPMESVVFTDLTSKRIGTQKVSELKKMIVIVSEQCGTTDFAKINRIIKNSVRYN